MTVLNEGIRFSDLPEGDRRAFLRPPERRLFAHTKLYKLTSYPLEGPRGITPWWSFFERVRLGDGTAVDGYKEAEEFAHRLQVSHQTYQRARSAVSNQFGNSMSNLLIIQLQVKAWGFAGIARGQREFSDEEIKEDPSLANVYLIGGRVQAYIPNLKTECVQPIPTSKIS